MLDVFIRTSDDLQKAMIGEPIRPDTFEVKQEPGSTIKNAGKQISAALLYCLLSSVLQILTSYCFFFTFFWTSSVV